MIFSRGWPCFSYIASMKKGSMTSIMHMAATLLPAGPRSKKKSGTPMSAPPPKQTSCLLVKLNATLVFTLVRSLGTGTYAIFELPPSWSVRLNYGFGETA